MAGSSAPMIPVSELAVLQPEATSAFGAKGEQVIFVVQPALTRLVDVQISDVVGLSDRLAQMDAKLEGISAITPTAEGFSAALAAVIVAFTRAPEFQDTFETMFAAFVNARPDYSGTGLAPVPAGKFFMNDGTLQQAK